MGANKQRSLSAYQFQRGIGPVFLTGRVLGALPFTNVLDCWRHSDLILHSRWISSTAAFTLSMVIYSVVCFILITKEAWKESSHLTSFSPARLIRIALGPSFTFTVVFTYSYFLWKSKRLSEIISDFVNSFKHVHQLSPGEINFPKSTFSLSLFLWILCIIENFMYDMQRFQSEDMRGKSTLEKYFIQTGGHFINILPYHPALTIILVVYGKFMSYLGTFVDLFSITLCHALTVRLNATTFQLKNQLFLEAISIQQCGEKVLTRLGPSSVRWEDIRREFLHHCDLAKSVSSFLSPLIIVSYGYNIFVMILQIFNWLNPRIDSSVEQTVYVYFSYLTFSMRVILLTYFSSNVYHSTESLSETLLACPPVQFTKDAERLERLVDGHPAKISIFNTFVVTRKFFMSVLSFICTTQIVLLQTESSANS